MVASSAHAADWKATPSPVSVAQSIADIKWPNSPCRGKAVIEIVPEAQIDADLSQSNSNYVVGSAGGYMIWGTCWARVMYTPYKAAECAMIAHELGHMAGLEHDNTHPNIMNGEHLYLPNACQRWEWFPGAHPRKRYPHGHSKRIRILVIR